MPTVLGPFKHGRFIIIALMVLRDIMLFLHIVLASLWVGGMLFLVLVLAPFVRKLPTKNQVFQEVGRRFSFYGTLIALLGLFITGLFNVHYTLGFSNIFNFSNPYTLTLWHKIGLFILIVVISLLHDLYFGKKALEKVFHRWMARLLGFVNLLLSLAVVYFAVLLRFGG
jgi:putative copper export protein